MGDTDPLPQSNPPVAYRVLVLDPNNRVASTKDFSLLGYGTEARHAAECYARFVNSNRETGYSAVARLVLQSGEVVPYVVGPPPSLVPPPTPAAPPPTEKKAPRPTKKKTDRRVDADEKPSAVEAVERRRFKRRRKKWRVAKWHEQTRFLFVSDPHPKDTHRESFDNVVRAMEDYQG